MQRSKSISCYGRGWKSISNVMQGGLNLSQMLCRESKSISCYRGGSKSILNVMHGSLNLFQMLCRGSIKHSQMLWRRSKSKPISNVM